MSNESVSFPEDGTPYRERWLSKARGQSLGHREAVQSSARLLRELDGYLARRRRRGYHTGFDDLLGALLPGLALANALLAAGERPLAQENVPEQWGNLHPEMRALLEELAVTLGLPVRRARRACV